MTADQADTLEEQIDLKTRCYQLSPECAYLDPLERTIVDNNHAEGGSGGADPDGEALETYLSLPPFMDHCPSLFSPHTPATRIHRTFVGLSLRHALVLDPGSGTAMGIITRKDLDPGAGRWRSKPIVPTLNRASSPRNSSAASPADAPWSWATTALRALYELPRRLVSIGSGVPVAQTPRAVDRSSEDLNKALLDGPSAESAAAGGDLEASVPGSAGTLSIPSSSSSPLPDVKKMTKAECQSWLVAHGHETLTWELSKSNATKADYVAAIEKFFSK
jgi:hypothetical protein